MSLAGSSRHDKGMVFGCRCVKRKAVPGKVLLEHLFGGLRQRHAPFARWQQGDTREDFGLRHTADVYGGLYMQGKPIKNARVWALAHELGKHICIEQKPVVHDLSNAGGVPCWNRQQFGVQTCKPAVDLLGKANGLILFRRYGLLKNLPYFLLTGPAMAGGTQSQAVLNGFVKVLDGDADHVQLQAIAVQSLQSS